MSTPKNVISARPGDTAQDYTQNGHTLRYRRRPDGGFTPQYLLCGKQLASNRGYRKFGCQHGLVAILSDASGNPLLDFEPVAKARPQRKPANRYRQT